MKKALSASDYAAMAAAAEELAGMCTGARREMNKALSERYRALSVRGRVPADSRVVRKAMTGEV